MLDTPDDRIRQAMQRLGYTDFMSDAQRRMIEAVTDGSDVLSIMPTGSGKTAGAVVPALVHGWFVVVISPLISLMGDQRDSLNEIGIPAFSIDGNTEQPERILIRDTLRSLKAGPAFLFVSPEMALTPRFGRLMKSVRFQLMFVDEVHTVSVWGDSFREQYQRIRAIWKYFQQPQILAGSATADPFIVHDVKRRVPFRKGQLVEIYEDPVRENLCLRIERPPPERATQAQQREWATTRIAEHLADDYMPIRGPTIIYCTRIREVERLFRELATTAEANGFQPALYHSELEREHREHSLRLFRTAPCPLIVATSGFGMGIDRADVRTIIHYGPPVDLVEYAQQIGRSGRDGDWADCWTLYLPWMVERGVKAELGEVPDLEQVERVYAQLLRAWKYVTEQKQQTRFRLEFFHHQYDSWIQEQEHVIAPKRHMALRRQAVRILADLNYIEVIDGYVVRVAGMQFGSDEHGQLIELTQMRTRRAQRAAKRLRAFFTAEQPTQHLLFELIAQE